MSMSPVCQAPQRITPREHQVIRCLLDGRRNKEIATALAISEETVKNHLRSIRAKTGTSDRLAVAMWAVRQGLLHR